MITPEELIAHGFSNTDSRGEETETWFYEKAQKTLVSLEFHDNRTCIYIYSQAVDENNMLCYTPAIEFTKNKETLTIDKLVQFVEFVDDEYNELENNS